MPSKAEVQQHQRAFLQSVKDRTQPVTVTIEDIEIVLNPGVFPPATDTRLLASCVDVKEGDRFIDMTTGSGVIAIKAAKNGATGIAVDINPSAVQCAKENVARHEVNVEVIESDMWSNVPDEQFDAIYANGPFFEGDITDPLDYACYGARAFNISLFSGVKDRLKPNGKLLIVVSEHAELDHLVQTAQNNGMTIIQRPETQSSSDRERNYLLYEARLKVS